MLRYFVISPVLRLNGILLVVLKELEKVIWKRQLVFPKTGLGCAR